MEQLESLRKKFFDTISEILDALIALCETSIAKQLLMGLLELENREVANFKN